MERISRKNEPKLTPGRAVRKFCLHCCGNNEAEVRRCDANSDPNYASCLFHKHRLSKGRVSVRTIRKVCLSCMGNSSAMVEACLEINCPIYIYRFGKNPSCADRMPTHLIERTRTASS
jgi:hypothetical protein